jgi:hypothetical protein
MADRPLVVLANLCGAKLRPWNLRGASWRGDPGKDRSDLATDPAWVDGPASVGLCWWSGSLLRGVFPDLMHGFASLSDTTICCVGSVEFRRWMARARGY